MAKRKPIASRFCRVLLLSVSLHLIFCDVSTAGPAILVQAGQSIQEAIDAAPDGSTVEVSPGTYLENIDFRGKAIHLKSTHGPGATVLDGSHPADPDRASVVTFESGEGEGSVLEGFTLAGGNGTRNEHEGKVNVQGGGIFCLDASPRVIGCVLLGNYAEIHGGGVYARGNSSPSFTDCTFCLNIASAYGGGVCFDGCSPHLEDCRFLFNRASLGGGAGLFHNCTPELSRCVITHNTALHGGGVYLGGEAPGTAILRSCIFSRNTAMGNGAALFASKSSFVFMEGSTVFRNRAKLRGGGLLLDGAVGSVTGSILASNGGTGLSLWNDSSLSLSHSDVWGNTAGDAEGAEASIARGEGNLSADPLLTWDGHLTGPSPCRNAGQGGSPSGIDIDGEPRPSGAPDIGADQFLDSDRDQLPDFWERLYGLPEGEPTDTRGDPDGDGLDNEGEYTLDGHPLLPDSEFTLSGDRDEDRDGLSNREERILMTLRWDLDRIRDGIRDPDADGDLFPDGLEARLGTDPTDGGTHPGYAFGEADRADLDAGSGDGLADGLELQLFKTLPGLRDTDADGFDDGREVETGSDPVDMISTPMNDGVITGSVKMIPLNGGRPVGVNRVKVALYDAEDGALLDSAVTDPLFGGQGAFVFAVEDLAGRTDVRLDVLEIPGGLRVMTPLPLVVTVGPYPPAVPAEILLEGFLDTDEDGVPDGAELSMGTDPGRDDTDGDGLADGYEIVQRSNAGASCGAAAGACCCDPLLEDAGEDPDGDLIPNRLEKLLGTDPNDGGNELPCPGSQMPAPELGEEQTHGWVKVRLQAEQDGASVEAFHARSLIPGAVTGRVFDGVSGTGIEGARVFFFRGPGCPPVPLEGRCEVQSGPNGIFWSLLQGADYSMKICTEGYYPVTLNLPDGDEGFVQAGLFPSGPESISPDAWEGISGVRSEGERLPSARDPRPRRVRTQADGETNRLLLIPLPVHRWGGDGNTTAAGGRTGYVQTGSEGELLNERYRAVASTRLSSGTSIVRVEPARISEAVVRLDNRPGDATTAGASGEHRPDGDVSEADALYGLAMAAGKTDETYGKALDVLSLDALHGDADRLVFSQDGRVGLEDALAILRQAHGFLDPALPEDWQALKRSAVFRLQMAEGAAMRLFDHRHEPVGSSPITGTMDLEILSCPLDASGSSFRIRTMRAETVDPIYVPIPGEPSPVPYFFEAWMEEGDSLNATGTIVPGAGGGGVYSFQIDNVRMSFRIRDPGGQVLFPPVSLRWQWKGILFTDQTEGDSVRVQIQISDLFFGNAYFDFLLDLGPGS